MLSKYLTSISVLKIYPSNAFNCKLVNHKTHYLKPVPLRAGDTVQLYNPCLACEKPSTANICMREGGCVCVHVYEYSYVQFT